LAALVFVTVGTSEIFSTGFFKAVSKLKIKTLIKNKTITLEMAATHQKLIFLGFFWREGFGIGSKTAASHRAFIESS